MVTQYNAIVMASSPVPGIGARDVETTSDDRCSFLLLCQPEWISITVHSKLLEDQQCTWPTHRRYVEADMEGPMSKISERPVTDTVVFEELWKRRPKAQVMSLEEWVLEHWTFGRIVLAGDAVHKVTPNSALGGNTAPKLNFVEFEERRGILGLQDTMVSEKKYAMKGKISKKGRPGMSWNN